MNVLVLIIAAVMATFPIVSGSAATPTFSISGTVSGSVEDPFAKVVACPAANPDEIKTGCRYTSSGTGGAYKLDNVPLGSYIVSFEGGGRNPDLGSILGYYSSVGFVRDRASATPVVVLNAGVTGVSIQFPTPYKVSGRVLAPDGSPVPGDTAVYGVQLCVRRWCGPVWTQADGGGSYRLYTYGGTYQVQAYGSPYMNTWYTTQGSKPGPASLVVDRDMAGIDIVMRIPTTIRGQVVNGTWSAAQACSDETGCFDADMLGRYFDVTAPPGTYAIAVWSMRRQFLPGYYSETAGTVADAVDATKVTTSESIGISGVDAVARPLALAGHAGSSRGGSFASTVTAPAGKAVTLRIVTGSGFAGTTVAIFRATVSRAGKVGTYKALANVHLGMDGTGWYSSPVARGEYAYQARYAPTDPNLANAEAWSGIVRVRSR